jgi:hypothetical protein
MPHMRTCIRRAMKLAGATVILVGLMGLYLIQCAGGAASKCDEWTSFLCVPTAVAGSVAEGGCRAGKAKSENRLDFFKVELRGKTIRAED